MIQVFIILTVHWAACKVLSFQATHDKHDKVFNFASSPSSFVSKGLMAEQTFVLSQVADSAPCIATRTIKVTLKQAANNKRILKTQENKSCLLAAEFC